MKDFRDETLLGVLILIVMDNGLSPGELKLLSVEVAGLNPYCNG